MSQITCKALQALVENYDKHGSKTYICQISREIVDASLLAASKIALHGNHSSTYHHKVVSLTKPEQTKVISVIRAQFLELGFTRCDIEYKYSWDNTRWTITTTLIW